LLDMTMPRMSGDEALREMQRVRPEVRVVVSSGYSEQEALYRFDGAGCFGFVQKPYEPSTLINAVRQACDMEHAVVTQSRLM